MAITAQKVPLPSREIKLPEARLDGPLSIEKILSSRRSLREFSNIPLELYHIAQLAWAAQALRVPKRIEPRRRQGRSTPWNSMLSQQT